MVSVGGISFNDGILFRTSTHNLRCYASGECIASTPRKEKRKFEDWFCPIYLDIFLISLIISGPWWIILGVYSLRWTFLGIQLHLTYKVFRDRELREWHGAEHIVLTGNIAARSCGMTSSVVTMLFDLLGLPLTLSEYLEVAVYEHPESEFCQLIYRISLWAQVKYVVSPPPEAKLKIASEALNELGRTLINHALDYKGKSEKEETQGNS